MNKKLIKSFDEHNNFNNVIVPLSIDIDEVIFIFHHDIEQIKFDNCKKVINKYKNIKITFRKVDKKDTETIVSDKVLVDVSASKYISLVLHDYALKNGLNIIYYDEIEKKIKEYNTHSIYKANIFKLSIEDMLNLNGGRIVSSLHKPIKKRESIELIYRIINECNEYNRFISFISKINSLVSYLEHNKNIYYINEAIKDKILSDDNYLRFKKYNLFTFESNKLIFFNEEIGHMFEISGSFLENYLYHKLSDSKEFDDVQMSVTIEFNNEQWKYPVRCELDCLVIKDNNLLFTSIKSNKVETSDLNEIKVHNVMFGNQYSKPVICINSNLSNDRPNIYAKGEELKIAIIDEDTFRNDEVVNKFISIINNTYKYDKLGG